MSTKTTYILFGSTNPYLAKFGLFNGRTRFAQSVEYCTAEDASAKLMSYCAEESDNYSFNEFGTKVQYMVSCDEERNTIEWETIMDQGDMSYEHDSRTWEFIALNDLDEDDARIVLRDNVLSETETAMLYELHPDLRPEEVEDADGE